MVVGEEKKKEIVVIVMSLLDSHAVLFVPNLVNY